MLIVVIELCSSTLWVEINVLVVTSGNKRISELCGVNFCEFCDFVVFFYLGHLQSIILPFGKQLNNALNVHLIT